MTRTGRGEDPHYGSPSELPFSLPCVSAIFTNISCFSPTTLSTDTDGKTEPVDPLAALEKTTDAQTQATKVQAPRLEQLEDLSAHYNDDPYAHSQRVRKRFRAEKKVERVRAEADKSLKNKYGLPAELALERADDPGIAAEARDEWGRGRAARAGENVSKKHRLALEAPVLPAPPRRGVSASTESAVSSLQARILSNSAWRTANGAGGIDALIPPTS
jgi:coiled-coil domain-containing protein 130